MTYKEFLTSCANNYNVEDMWSVDQNNVVEREKISFLKFVMHNAQSAYKQMKKSREPDSQRPLYIQKFYDSKTDDEIFFGYLSKNLKYAIDTYTKKSYMSITFEKESLIEIILEEFPFLYGIFFSYGRTYSDFQMNNEREEKEKIIKENNELKEKIKILAHINEIEDVKLNELFQSVPESKEIIETIISLKNRIGLLESSKSNISAIPYMAQIMADYETYGLEMLAKSLDWGHSIERLKKVESIREIRRKSMEIVEKNKNAQYQLAYLLELYPVLQEVIECDYNQMPIISFESMSEYDHVRDYLTKEEYERLTRVEKNQLALDRYKESHTKTKWQIGRDYENYIGYKCSDNGLKVEYPGSFFKLNDLGRDIIAKSDSKIFIIQCKYWSSVKEIHEKHIMQLHGTVVSYCVENGCDENSVKGVLVTNIGLSSTAKKIASYLNIEYKEFVSIGDYPLIKCNVGHGENGETKIYHLPFDQQYDSTKIENSGEFYANTVEEAEKAGFRRAFRWYGE